MPPTSWSSSSSTPSSSTTPLLAHGDKTGIQSHVVPGKVSTYVHEGRGNAIASSSKVKLEDLGGGHVAKREGKVEGEKEGLGKVGVPDVDGKGKRKYEFSEGEYSIRADKIIKHNILLDQSITTSSSINLTAFSNYTDVVDRLIPWHIWQVHDVDQDHLPKSKGRKVDEWITTEKIIKRKNAIEARFRRLRINAFDTHATLIPDIQVSTNLLSTARESLTGTMASLRDVRAELESLEEEKKKRLEVEKRKKLVGGGGGGGAGGGGAGGAGGGGAGTGGGETRIGGTTGTTGTTSGSGQQPILISVPMSSMTQLAASNIIQLDPKSPLIDGKIPPAKAVRAWDDMSHMQISVNVAACNPAQLNLLAQLIQKQKGAKT